MQEAGIDSGMTQSATVASGLQGAWKETSTDYSNINSAGLMAYRVGYDSAMYSVYLRRDGTLPMTGDLNMGGNDINNVKDITASGTATVATLKSTGTTTVGSTLTVGGALNANNDLTVVGVSTLKGAASLNSTLSVAGASTLTGGLTVNNVINASGNITSSGQVKGATVVSTGRMTAGEFLQINGTATVGAGCSPNGLQGKSSIGALLSCVSGIWKANNPQYMKVGGVFTIYPGTTKNLGRFKLCINTYRIDGQEMALTQLIPTDNPDSNGNMNWRAHNGTQYSSYYMGIHCFI